LQPNPVPGEQPPEISHLGAETDVDLARKLAIDKSTVSSWRSRDNLPDRYLRILHGEDKQTVATPPLKWGQYEDYAFRLALFRYAKARGEAAQSADFKTVWTTFTHIGGFWKLMHESQKDLAQCLEEQTSVMDTAFAIVLHEDLEAGASATDRDRATLDFLKHPDR